jgi:hypothetical protein
MILAASVTFADISRRCVNPDICFSLNIPETTASSGSGDLFLQITAPTSYSWVSVAQGKDTRGDMGGAHYFVMYASADGTNVTVSPRVANGEVMPTYNSETRIELLEGSGVNDTTMTANIRCEHFSTPSTGS